MLISDEEVQERSELSIFPISENPRDSEIPEIPIDQAEHKPEHPAGKEDGSHNLDPDARASLGTLGRALPNAAVAEMFGISKQSVSDYSNGRIGSRKDQDLGEAIEERISGIQDQAITRLLSSLNLVGSKEETIRTAREAASIAKDMAVIVDKVRDKRPVSIGQANIVFYSPKPREESSYEVVEV